MIEATWLADLLQESGHEIYIIDAHSLRLLEISEAARRNLQYTSAELAALQAPDLMLGLSADQLRQCVEKLRTGTESEICIDTTHQRRDGSRYDLTLRLSFLQLQKVSALIASSTELRDGNTVVSREERLAQIESHVPGLLFQMRQGKSGLLQFSFLSPACRDVLGVSPEALYVNPHRFFSLIAEEDRVHWTDALRQSLLQLSVLNWEGRIWIDSWQDSKWINLRATPQLDGDEGVRWTGLMTNITQSKQQQAEILRSREQLAELSAHIEHVKEQERERIERDLHDDLGGNLSALKMMLNHVWKQIPQTPYLQECYDYLEMLLNRSLESIHRISADLRPGILNAGLVAALEWFVQEQEKQTGTPYVLRCNAPDIDMDPHLATALFRVVQEACNNIRKHAQASLVEIHLYDGCSELLMEIIDNGIGIDEPRRQASKSFGLRSMSERIASLNGEFSVASRPGKGTIVTVRVPLPEPLPPQE